ncbi:MAG TPA: GNAT family N-acetyltransferase [Candidatus Acidoferrales bacterium]|nr:GNAT family N-acetyltransferase [Candidatus Acidoferrales bacterium]
MRARRARSTDAGAIHALISYYAAEGILLPRTEENVREHVRGFLVLEEKGEIAGCVALENYGTELAEIRSLAVSPKFRKRGLGARLVQYAILEARRQKTARVFAVTHAPEFFTRQGFGTSARHTLPEKIARDCSVCPKVRRCRLVAVIATVIPERVALPILNDVAASSPAA